VPQGLEGVSYDIPLVNDGFGPCWAAIVFDRTSGRSCLIHVDDFEAKEEQRAQIEKHLSLPNSGAREAVILHALRTHAGEFSKEYFYKIGCQRVDMISFDSQSKHWAIGYYPEQNVLDIVTKTGVQGSVAIRYRAFSDAVYDSELRSTQNLSEKLFEKTWTALSNQRYDTKWIEKNGHFSQLEFAEFISDARQIWDRLGSPDQVSSLLVENKYAYYSGETLVIPRMLHWMKDEISNPFYDLTHIKSDFSLRFRDKEDSSTFITALAAQCCGAQTKHLDKNILFLESPGDASQVLINFGYDKITFHEVVKGDMLRKALEICSSIMSTNTFNFTFSGPFSDSRNWMPVFTPEKWSRIEKEIELFREL
jgi:hypothetical protein